MRGAVGVLAKGYFCSLSRFFFFLWFPPAASLGEQKKNEISIHFACVFVVVQLKVSGRFG